jgi:hypothetical protein
MMDTMPQYVITSSKPMMDIHKQPTARVVDVTMVLRNRDDLKNMTGFSPVVRKLNSMPWVEVRRNFEATPTESLASLLQKWAEQWSSNDFVVQDIMGAAKLRTADRDLTSQETLEALNNGDSFADEVVIYIEPSTSSFAAAAAASKARVFRGRLPE